MMEVHVKVSTLLKHNLKRTWTRDQNLLILNINIFFKIIKYLVHLLKYYLELFLNLDPTVVPISTAAPFLFAHA